MGVYSAAGARLTKATLVSAAGTVGDPEMVLDRDLFQSVAFDPSNDGVPQGSLLEVLAKNGDVVRTSKFNSWFPAATVSAVAPATGTTAGGTAVTLTGANLDGVSGVTFGGTAATSVVIVSSTSITCVTPAKTAGAKDVVLADDAGAVTKTGFYTYA